MSFKNTLFVRETDAKGIPVPHKCQIRLITDLQKLPSEGVLRQLWCRWFSRVSWPSFHWLGTWNGIGSRNQLHLAKVPVYLLNGCLLRAFTDMSSSLKMIVRLSVYWPSVNKWRVGSENGLSIFCHFPIKLWAHGLSDPHSAKFPLGPLEIGPVFEGIDKSQRNGAAFQRQQRKSQNRFALLLYARSLPIRCWLRAALLFEEKAGRALWQSPFPNPTRTHLASFKGPMQLTGECKKTFLDRRRTASDAGEQALTAAAFRNLFDTFPHYFGGTDHSQSWKKNKRSSELLLQMKV